MLLDYQEGIRRALRTFLQTLGGSLGGLSATDAISTEFSASLWLKLAVAAQGAFLAAAVAFLQNVRVTGGDAEDGDNGS